MRRPTGFSLPAVSAGTEPANPPPNSPLWFVAAGDEVPDAPCRGGGATSPRDRAVLYLYRMAAPRGRPCRTRRQGRSGGWRCVSRQACATLCRFCAPPAIGFASACHALPFAAPPPGRGHPLHLRRPVVDVPVSPSLRSFSLWHLKRGLAALGNGESPPRYGPLCRALAPRRIPHTRRTAPRGYRRLLLLDAQGLRLYSHARTSFLCDSDGRHWRIDTPLRAFSCSSHGASGVWP